MNRASGRSTSPTDRTSPTRATASRSHQPPYAPAVPSQLREAHWPPPTPLSAPAQPPSQDTAHEDYFSVAAKSQGEASGVDGDTVTRDDRPPVQSHSSWAKASGYSPGRTTSANYGSFSGGTQSPASYPDDDSDAAETNSPGKFTQALRARMLRAKTRMNTGDWMAKTAGARSSKRM